MRLIDILTDGKLDKAKFHLELIKYVTQASGYDFDIKRLERIAEVSRKLMDQGAPFAWAYTEALDLELLLYGDPYAPKYPELIPIINHE